MMTADTHRRGVSQRSCLFSVIGLLSLSCLTATALGQDQSQPKLEKAVTQQTVMTSDGWTIHFTYYQADGGELTPVVMLLHGRGGNRLAYRTNLAKQLHDHGYAVAAVDLRMHGESRNPTETTEGSSATSADASNLRPADYVRMVTEDLEAVKGFLLKEHQEKRLNIRKLGIVAADAMAPVATTFALQDWTKIPYDDAPTLSARTPRGQDVRALVLISPDATAPGMSTTKALIELRRPELQIGFMIAVGSKDTQDKGQAQKMYKQLTGLSINKDRMYLQQYPYKLRGTDLLGKNLRVEDHIQVFLDKHLKELDINWQNRIPRYNRGQ